MEFIQRQKQDVKQVKIILSKQSRDTQTLDKVHAKVQTIEQNIKNFKLKSRATYQILHEEEVNLDAELNALADKFERWETEEDGLNKYQNFKVGGKQPLRAGSVGASSRLMRTTYASRGKK